MEYYETSYRQTQSFIQWKFKRDDINIKEMKFEFITDYEFWLKTVRKCEHNTTVKYLSNFKKIIHICMNNGWLSHDPFVGFKMSKREIERPFLVQEELDAIIEKNFTIQRIDQVRDIFVFCCYTGLSYADVEKLTGETSPPALMVKNGYGPIVRRPTRQRAFHSSLRRWRSWRSTRITQCVFGAIACCLCPATRR